MTAARQQACRFEPGRTAPDDKDVARHRCGLPQRSQVVLATGGGVGNAVERLLHEDVADAAVLVDARPDVADPAVGQLVGQVGVGEQLAAHGDEVGPPVGQHPLGVLGLEATERDDRDVDPGPHGRRVLAQGPDGVGRVGVGGSGRDVGAGVGGDVHRVDARGQRELDGAQLVVERLAVGLVVLDGVDADPERVLGAQSGAHGPQHLAEQAGPVLDAATPPVATNVERRGQELVERVAVPRVQLDADWNEQHARNAHPRRRTARSPRRCHPRS